MSVSTASAVPPVFLDAGGEGLQAVAAGYERDAGAVLGEPAGSGRGRAYAWVGGRPSDGMRRDKKKRLQSCD